MENNRFRRRLTISFILIFGTVILLITSFVLARTVRQPDELLFDTIEGSERVGKGRFQLQTESGQVSLLNLETRQLMTVPTKFSLTGQDLCENCIRFISVPQQDDYITLEFATKKNWPCEECVFEADIEYVDYLITRQHNGGSGGYYKHRIFEVTDDELKHKGTFLSCGDVYTQGHRLIFSAQVESCPEFDQMSWFRRSQGWEDEIFYLRDN